MSKFARCYPANGMMWCQHFNGSYAPPFPIADNRKEKSPEEGSASDNSEVEDKQDS